MATLSSSDYPARISEVLESNALFRHGQSALNWFAARPLNRQILELTIE